MIERDPEGRSRDSYDLLIVGAGCYGATLALESARRGLRPLLVERRDFCNAASWHSLRIVHGGLRYLQTLDLRRFRESVAERSWFLRHFPDQVLPLACLMPLYNDGLRRPPILRAALKLNDLLSRSRNDGVRADRVLAGGQLLSAAQTIERFPDVEQQGLKGGALWHDGVMPDAQRLIIEILHWTVACGGAALNYVQADGLLERDGRVEGLRATDVTTGAPLEFRAPLVVNCAGPWCREVAASLDRDVPDLFPYSVAFNLMLDRPAFSDAALAVAPRIPGGRMYFLFPWKGRILAGTYHVRGSDTREESRLGEADVQNFLSDLNQAIPAFQLRSRDVLRVHWAPIPARHPGTEQPGSREVIHHHAAHGGPEGLFSVSGVKFTTARCVAEKTLRRIRQSQGTTLPALGDVGRPAERPVPTLSRFLQLLRDDRERAAACVRELVDEESVVRLEDLLLRRTDWASNPREGKEIAADVARLLAWDRERIDRELLELDRAMAT